MLPKVGPFVIDIPADTNATHEHARINDTDGEHGIVIQSGSILTKITVKLKGQLIAHIIRQ